MPKKDLDGALGIVASSLLEAEVDRRIPELGRMIGRQMGWGINEEPARGGTLGPAQPAWFGFIRQGQLDLQRVQRSLQRRMEAVVGLMALQSHTGAQDAAPRSPGIGDHREPESSPAQYVVESVKRFPKPRS